MKGVRRGIGVVLFGAAAAASLAAGAVWLSGDGALAQQQGGAQASTPAGGAPSGPVVPVSVVKVARQDVPVWLHGLGTVQPNNAVQVRTRVDGVLQEVAVTEGQEVKKGDLLAVIDPRPFKAALDAAIARRQQDVAGLENAKLDLVRYTALAQKEVASRQKLDAVTAQVNQLTAAIAADDALVSAAELNLTFCYILAPFDARVGLRSVDPGNIVRAAEAAPMFNLVQIRPITATFTVPQDNLPAIQDAMARGAPPVVAYASDDKTEIEKGALVTVDNTIDQASGTIKLKASFANERNRLWPGQFVNMRLLVSVDKGVATLPTQAVLQGPTGPYVYIVKPDNTVARQDVEIARDDGFLVVLRKGPEEGQTVVRDGQSRLRAGSRVAANDPAARPAQQQQPPKTGG